MILLNLFWEFFKTGLFSVGGGLATLPFLSRMVYSSHQFSIVYKDGPLHELREALRATSRHERYISQRALEIIITHQQAEEDRPKVQPAREKKVDRNAPIEVDLHAHELLETTAGMSAGDIKEYQLGVFRKTMDEHIKEKGRRIVFIHGKGDGILRQLVRQYLATVPNVKSFRDEHVQFGGAGITVAEIG